MELGKFLPRLLSRKLVSSQEREEKQQQQKEKQEEIQNQRNGEHGFGRMKSLDSGSIELLMELCSDCDDDNHDDTAASHGVPSIDNLDQSLRTLVNANPSLFAKRLTSLLNKASMAAEMNKAISVGSGCQSISVLLPRLTSVITQYLNVERCTIFLNDPQKGELYTKALCSEAIAAGDKMEEIRFPNQAGIAGSVFTDEVPLIVPDAYADERFNPEIDRETGFKTRNIMCAPIWKVDDDVDASMDVDKEKMFQKRTVVGVAQAVNKKGHSHFTTFDLSLLQTMTMQAASALVHAHLLDENTRMKNIMVEISQVMATHCHSLETLLPNLTAIIKRYLEVERCTIFLHDTKTGELYSYVSEDEQMNEIRFPCQAGIAGSVFTEKKALVIPDAYSDERFNKQIDRDTGFRTRSILCAPIWKTSFQKTSLTGSTTSEGQRRVIGVTQAVNKKGGKNNKAGSFSKFDLSLLETMTTQAAHALASASLAHEVVRTKNYNESLLQSIRDGIIGTDMEGNVVKVNRAAMNMLYISDVPSNPNNVLGLHVNDIFESENEWLADGISVVVKSGESRKFPEASLHLTKKYPPVEVKSATLPLMGDDGTQIGCITQLEDVTKKNRMRNTMSRYMSERVLKQLLDSEEEAGLGGKSLFASVLFSDIRGFTSISEKLGSAATVKMLNEYFSIMTDIIYENDGSVDKFIGDAIMVTYGVPFPSESDADNAVCTAIAMQRKLRAFNILRADKNECAIRIGIGINTGDVVSGNMGSLRRMDYTTIGDSVNLAARLEGACKAFGADILVSEFTIDKLHDPKKYTLREVDRICVKGKEEPVAIYEVLDHLCDDINDSKVLDMLPVYKQALIAYRGGKFVEAAATFKDVFERHKPADFASRVLYDRCIQLQSIPSSNWNGVWEMKSK